jgi:hypothetical protein
VVVPEQQLGLAIEESNRSRRIDADHRVPGGLQQALELPLGAIRHAGLIAHAVGARTIDFGDEGK